VGAIITLALNFLLIPTMSYYGSAIATIAAYGSMMSISYYLGNKYYPIPYDLKENGAISRYPYFSAVSFYGFRELCWNRFINRVPIFYLSQ
jgi:O-antigen/teichoic acid export membrane protein